MLLSTSIGVANAQTSATDEQERKDAVGHEKIDYRKQEVKVEREKADAPRVKIEVGDANFAVRWGSESKSGAVELVSMQKRYLGVADVYDKDNKFMDRVGIPVENVFWMNIAGIIEYADGDRDGMFGIQSEGKAGTVSEIMNDKSLTHEAVYKYVDLNKATWNLKDWKSETAAREDVDSRERSLSFTLVAENIPYEGVRNNSMRNSTAKLDAVEIVFYGTTKEETIDIESVPHFRVGTERDANDNIKVKDSTKIASSDVKGHVLNTTWKYDIRIKGWDGVHINDTTNQNDSRLFTVTETASATRMDERTGDWMKTQFAEDAKPKAMVGDSRRDAVKSAIGPEVDEKGRLNVCETGKITELGSAGERVKSTPTEYEKEEEKKKEELKPPPRETPAKNATSDEKGDSSADREDGTDSTNSDSEKTEDTAARAGSVTESENNSSKDDGNATPAKPKTEMTRKERLVEEKDDTYDRVTTDCADRGELKADAVKKETAIRGGSLHFEDNGADVGRLRWVNNATIKHEGEKMDFEVVYQVHGRRDVTKEDLPQSDNSNFRGVRLLGGFNYPVAEEVLHDPEFGSDLITIDEEEKVFTDATSEDQSVDDESATDSGTTNQTTNSNQATAVNDESKAEEGGRLPGFGVFVTTSALIGAAFVNRRSRNNSGA